MRHLSPDVAVLKRQLIRDLQSGEWLNHDIAGQLDALLLAHGSALQQRIEQLEEAHAEAIADWGHMKHLKEQAESSLVEQADEIRALKDRANAAEATCNCR